MTCVSSISVSPKKITLKEKHWYYDMKVEVLPQDATCNEVEWRSSNEDVATVNESTGYIYAKAPGTAKIRAVATDGSGVVDTCVVTVIEHVPVDFVWINENVTSMYEGNSKELSADVEPANATMNRIVWMSTEPSIIRIDADPTDSKKCKITALKPGGAVIVAKAIDGSEEFDCRPIQVLKKIPVTGISLTNKSIILAEDDTHRLKVNFTPKNATNTRLTWTSSNQKIATVDNLGNVTAISRNTNPATITVKSSDGGYTDRCKVTVIDPAKKVMVRKDGIDHFTVEFDDGNVWKNIGCDLSLSENQSGTPLWQENLPEAEFNENELRYLHNCHINYSESQIAFLYLLDPLGIEYYMKRDACRGMSELDTLKFKDKVYIDIFGDNPGWFYFQLNDNGNPEYVYGNDPKSHREKYFSNAEILFGFHKYFDWSRFWEQLLTEGFWNIPGISTIKLGVDIYQALFFSGSIVGICSDKASSYVKDYVEAPIKDKVKDIIGKEVASKAVFWVINLIKMATEYALDSFVVPNINDISIYNKVKENNNYYAVFEIGGNEVSMQDFIYYGSK